MRPAARDARQPVANEGGPENAAPALALDGVLGWKEEAWLAAGDDDRVGCLVDAKRDALTKSAGRRLPDLDPARVQKVKVAQDNVG